MYMIYLGIFQNRFSFVAFRWFCKVLCDIFLKCCGKEYHSFLIHNNERNCNNMKYLS